MATITYKKAKDIIIQGVIPKNSDLLILENSTIRDIKKAYETARDEIAREIQRRYNYYIASAGKLTEQGSQLARLKILKDAKLYENLESIIDKLGGKVDKISFSGILQASGISNEWVKRELEALSFFTNIDPKSFALINRVQAELAVNTVNEGTKFVNDIVKQDTLTKMRQQIRIGILKGDSIDAITQRIVSKTPLTLEGVKKGVFSSIEQRARLNARWGIIESSNSAAVTQYNSFNTRCADSGVKVAVSKQIIAHVDERTSVTCLHADGQIQPLDKPFETDQGLLDYPPFHPNCRSTVCSWHELYEQFGKSTKEIQAEAQAELDRRAKAAGKEKAKKIINKKALKATQKTIPGEWKMPEAKSIKEAESLLKQHLGLSDVSYSFKYANGETVSVPLDMANRINQQLYLLNNKYGNSSYLRSFNAVPGSAHRYASTSSDGTNMEIGLKFFKDSDMITKSIQKDILSKWHPDIILGQEAESVITHEYAHTIWNNYMSSYFLPADKLKFAHELITIKTANTRLLMNAFRDYKDGKILVEEFNKIRNLNLISEYAKKDTTEYFAEAFASYNHSIPKKQNQWVKKVMDSFNKIFSGVK